MDDVAVQPRATTNKERPIVFSGEMVQAILAGRKTQTRRVIRPQPACGCRYEINGAYSAALHVIGEWNKDIRYVPPTPRSKDHRLPCPFGRPGNHLWVRETWALIRPWYCQDTGGVEDFDEWTDSLPDCLPYGWSIARRVEWGDTYDHPDDRCFRWRSPLHMPRWASRLTLEITDVRVERLRDISEEDCYSEGIPEWTSPEQVFSPVVRFRELWDSLNAKRGHPWESNPWVWVIAFKTTQTSP